MELQKQKEIEENVSLAFEQLNAEKIGTLWLNYVNDNKTILEGRIKKSEQDDLLLAIMTNPTKLRELIPHISDILQMESLEDDDLLQDCLSLLNPGLNKSFPFKRQLLMFLAALRWERTLQIFIISRSSNFAAKFIADVLPGLLELLLSSSFNPFNAHMLLSNMLIMAYLCYSMQITDFEKELPGFDRSCGLRYADGSSADSEVISETELLSLVAARYGTK
jgi:hypothetical protein